MREIDSLDCYRWRPEKVSLVSGSPAGNATQATEPIHDDEGKITLRCVIYRRNRSCH